jgi:hypothetical protein
MSKSERSSRYALAGRVRNVTVLSGDIGADPWALLTTPLITDPRRIASTHHDWGVRLFEERASPTRRNAPAGSNRSSHGVAGHV